MGGKKKGRENALLLNEFIQIILTPGKEKRMYSGVGAEKEVTRPKGRALGSNSADPTP